MLYAFYCEDTKDSLNKRRAVRPAHLKHWQEIVDAGRMVIGGPLLDQDGFNLTETGFSGSLIIAEFDSLEDAKSWAAADPYATAEVFARVTVKPFKKTLPNE